MKPEYVATSYFSVSSSLPPLSSFEWAATLFFAPESLPIVDALALLERSFLIEIFLTRSI